MIDLVADDVIEERSPVRLIRRLRGHRVAVIGISLISFWVVLATLAPWLGLQPPNAQDYAAIAHPTPSARHWLGVDPLGRDILSRLIWGARTVLTLAITAV
jgi:peptide/nickel transport system permease protein